QSKKFFIADRQVNQFISLPIEEGEFLMFLLKMSSIDK
ncbi:hypothetical protein M2454_002969, partial [Aequitasia blattaphilus]